MSRRRRSRQHRAAALERAARILDAAGPGTPEEQHAAALRLEARELTAPLRPDPNGMVVALSAIRIDALAGAGTAVAAYSCDTLRGTALVRLGILDDEHEGPTWYAANVPDAADTDLAALICEAIDNNSDAMRALADAGTAASTVTGQTAGPRPRPTRQPARAVWDPVNDPFN